jgi:hypothetical protein
LYLSVRSRGLRYHGRRLHTRPPGPGRSAHPRACVFHTPGPSASPGTGTGSCRACRKISPPPRAQGGPAMALPDTPAASSPSPSGSARTFPGFDPDLPLAPSVNNIGSAFLPASAGPGARRGPVLASWGLMPWRPWRPCGASPAWSERPWHPRPCSRLRACPLPRRPLLRGITREPGTLLRRRCDAKAGQ